MAAGHDSFGVTGEDMATGYDMAWVLQVVTWQLVMTALVLQIEEM